MKGLGVQGNLNLISSCEGKVSLFISDGQKIEEQRLRA